MSELLSVNHLSCGYGDRPVLNDVNLTVKEGETVLIAGPNGCGKSTLLKAIIGMLPITGGVPRYLKEVRPGLSAAENIQRSVHCWGCES